MPSTICFAKFSAILPALLIAGFLSSPSSAATADRISGALTNGQTVALKGNVHRKALPQFDQGPVDPAMRLGTITLMTAPTAAQVGALKQLLVQQQDRKSVNYHKWLTPAQYADRFGLSQNDVQQMTSWLKSKGFTGVHAANGRNWISFTGTAAQIQSAFSTEIHHYNVNGELHYANATAPVVPAAMKGVASGLRGLNDFLPKPRAIHRARPNYFSSALQSQFIAPGDIAAIYDISALYSAGIDGTGQKLAVMGRTDIYLADITDFRTAFGMSAISCTTDSNDVITACNDPHFQYVLDGTDPGLSPNGDISEADLDLEWSGAIAPGAQIIYVNSTDTFTSYYYAVDNQATLGETVISLSYGECEFYDNFVTDPTTLLPGPDELELMKANSEGITFVNSSGDTGAAECDDPSTVTTTAPVNLATMGLAVSYPASSPEVTGVGGTAIPLANFTSQYWSSPSSNATDGGTALSYIPEQSWNDDSEFADYCVQNGGTFCAQGGTNPVTGWIDLTSALTGQEDIGISSTGGGVSNCSLQNTNLTACISGFPQPVWQTVTIPSQASARFSPDVSFLATPNFPGYVYCTELSELHESGTGSSCASGIANSVDSDFSLIGGTSVSAPVFAGIVTLLNQYVAASGGLGNINPMLYTLADPANAAFHPITTGNNTVSCTGGEPSVQPVALQCPGAIGTTGVIGFQASNADATTGFNLVTGLGSVDVNNLAVAWAASLPANFSFTPTATSYQVAQGSPVDAAFTVAMNGGFTGPVSFACTDPAPASVCTAPNAINATGSVNFHITTSLPTTASLQHSDRGLPMFYAALLPGLLGILFTAGSGRSQRFSLRGMRFLGLVVIVGFSTLWLASCGGGSGGNNNPNPGTTPGTYQITVTATSGTTTSTQTFNLVVQ
jgi:subtilase family serine protease